ncbi:MAG: NAD(P)H-binding protein [Betaproteobacteria bacterium]|nr:NAD(P)H-binding protein [Betaproteobacteria bacterium]
MPDSAAASRALLAGASGLVGSFLLERLLASDLYSHVDAWVRHELPREHPKLHVEVIDFERLAERRVAAEDVYCCLGTTIRQAGSKDAFRRVDFDYPLALARAAAHDGARRFFVVSALGADPRSALLYSRMKGEMEEAVRRAGVPKIYVFRPSLLDGPRREFRLGERLAQLAGNAVSPLLLGRLARYRPIHADAVAAAMLAAAERDLPAGTFECEQIRALAGG